MKTFTPFLRRGSSVRPLGPSESEGAYDVRPLTKSAAGRRGGRGVDRAGNASPNGGMAAPCPCADQSCGMRTAALPRAFQASGALTRGWAGTMDQAGGLARRRRLERAAPFLAAGLLPFATLPLPPAVSSP